jgi:hypothetical protein
MCDRPVVPQPAVGLRARAARHGALDERRHVRAVPLLRRGGARQEGQQEARHQAGTRHRRAISRAALAAASIAAAACGEILDVAGTLDRADLAVLLLQPGTPPAPAAQFYVANNRLTTRNLVHLDAASNVFAQVRFPAGALATIGGAPAAASDSVLVTVQPEDGAYAVTVGATGVTFSAGSPPTVTFFYGRYGDFTASRTGSRYATATELAQALEVWREQSLGRYAVAAGSASAGTDALAATVSATGHYLVAAAR